jgi:multiple sugar transport system substrate-binding protein
MNVDKSIPKASLGWNQVDLGARFNSKNCAMMPNGPWQLEATEKAGINYGVVPLPKDVQEATVLGGESLVVSAKAPLDAVWKLITFMQDSKILTQSIIDGLGLLPMRTDNEQEEKWYKVPANRVFTQALKTARSRAYGPKYNEMQPHLWKMEQQVLTKQKSPQDAVNQAWSAIKPLLDSQQ